MKEVTNLESVNEQLGYKELSNDELSHINGGGLLTTIGFILGIGNFLVDVYNGWNVAKEEHGY